MQFYDINFMPEDRAEARESTGIDNGSGDDAYLIERT